MIRSMTGFGRASFRVANAAFDVELRAVNHRYLDVRLRLPRSMAAFEGELRERLQRGFARGKVECSVLTPEGGAPKPRLEIDLDAAREYARAAEQLRADGAVAGGLDAGALLALPGVARFSEPALPEDELRRALEGALDAAAAAADAMRVAEGAALERELLERVERVCGLADELEERAHTVAQAVRERLRKRSAQLAQETGLVDEARLHQEIVIAADRLDVTEEIVRLRSHASQFRDIVASGAAGQPVGRALDFLLQEFVREVNTVGSKGGDAPVAHLVVELKAELGRIREQVQNVE